MLFSPPFQWSHGFFKPIRFRRFLPAWSRVPRFKIPFRRNSVMYSKPLSFSPSAMRVVEWTHPTLGFRACVAIDGHSLGPALGGTRVRKYVSFEDAVAEAGALASAMSYKAALASLPLGGGKAVIDADLGRLSAQVRADFFADFGRFIDSLKGAYITTEDAGTTAEDMACIRQGTRYVVGLPEAMGGSGSPSPYTALGVLEGMKAAAEKAFGDASLAGKTVAVQGVGSVGSELVALLAGQGAKIVCADLMKERAQAMKEKFAAKIVTPEEIYSTACDVFAPCAFGGGLNEKTVPKLRARVVCGAANNQLASVQAGEQLHERGILYAPDFLVNAGGLIAVSAEPVVSGKPFDKEEVLRKVAEIETRTSDLLRFAEESVLPPVWAALVLAEQRMGV